MQNHAGEKPSQSAERHGHTLCSRYLVVVETCMSLASQVVKLTKQLKEWVTCSFHENQVWLLIVVLRFQPGLWKAPSCWSYRNSLASSSSSFLPPSQVLTASIHAISAEAKWYLNKKKCRASFLSRELKPQWTRGRSLSLCSHLRVRWRGRCGKHTWASSQTSVLNSLANHQKQERERRARDGPVSQFSQKEKMYIWEITDRSPGKYHWQIYYKN